MYTPNSFANQNLDQILKVTEENSFVTVVSFDDNHGPFFNHVPVLIERKHEYVKLIGHMAKRNPQVNHFRKNKAAKILVQGPHCYISPRWYVSGRDVPTWNYVAIHFSGSVQLVEDFNGLTNILKKTVDRYEASYDPPIAFELPDDLADPEILMSAITGFEFTIEKTDAKFKLSQNRQREDRVGVIEGLKEQKDDLSQSVRKFMLDLD